MLRLFVAATFLLAAVPAAAASAPSGGPTALELVKTCASGADTKVTSPACSGYWAGAVGMLRIAKTVSEDFPICLPEEGLSNTALVGLLTQYLDQHQEFLERSARSVVFRVLTEAYPCQVPHS